MTFVHISLFLVVVVWRFAHDPEDFELMTCYEKSRLVDDKYLNDKQATVNRTTSKEEIKMYFMQNSFVSWCLSAECGIYCNFRDWGAL